MKKIALHWRIVLGMLAGVAVGVVALLLDDRNVLGWDWAGLVTDFIKPLGTIFINALKLIAVPLIIASLIKGVTDLKDLSRLSAMGGAPSCSTSAPPRSP